MRTPWDVLKPEMLDDLVGWGLTGLWLDAGMGGSSW